MTPSEPRSGSHAAPSEEGSFLLFADNKNSQTAKVNRWHRLAVVLGTLWLFALGASPSLAHEGHAHTTAVPAENARAGLIYDGLVPADTGPCAGAFRVPVAEGPDGCTHGPDPAPAGVDVRDYPSISELRERQAPNFSQPGEDGPAEAAAVPCIGDGTSGNRIHAVYAYPADRADRYSQVAPMIREWAGYMSKDVENSAARTGGYRTLRWVTSACKLVVDRVRLSSQADDDYGRTVSELQALGYGRSDRKFVVWMDSNVLCGVAFMWGNIGRSDAPCWNHAELHELGHNLSAVDLSAPNSSGGWHCTDESDRMCYRDSAESPPMRQICPTQQERLLDCGGDDYFSTSVRPGSFLSGRPQFNLADSTFMAERDGRVPVFLPDTPAGYGGPRYSLRLHNADDRYCAYAVRPSDGARIRIFCVGYRGDREADITGALLTVADGQETVRLGLTGYEEGGGYAYGVTLKKDGEVILDERDGQAGVSGAKQTPITGTDSLSGASTFAERSVDLELVSPAAVRLSNGDDALRVYVNGTLIGSAAYKEDRTIGLGQLAAGDRITLEASNLGGGYAWNFGLEVDGQGVFSEAAGNAGVAGANGNDQSHPNQVVRRVVLDRSGQVLESYRVAPRGGGGGGAGRPQILPTGQRAAAIQKCKSKRKKRAKRRCLRAAKLLPA